MAKCDITGAWVGEYSYDRDSAFPVLPPAVGFCLNARPGWLGRFHGAIQDDSAEGVIESASMVGRVCGTRVSFRKQYPENYVFHEGRTITLSWHIQLTYGFAPDEHPFVPPVWYRGEYDEAKDVVAGTWHIKSTVIKLKRN